MSSTLLTNGAADRLVQAARDIAGERLRSATYFTKDDFEQLYLREDLERGADLTTFIGLEWRESDITGNAYEGTELGEHLFTLRRFENGYLLRVTTGRGGVFVTLNGLSLEGFDDVANALRDTLDAVHGSGGR